MQSLVSICMPAYNSGQFIAQAIQSVIDQTHKNWELIVVNDGSTDNTQEIIARFEKDERIGSFVTTNGGAARARNIAYSYSKGNYIIFFDADDLLSPDFLKTQLTKVFRNPKALVLADWGRFYNDKSTTPTVEPILFNEMTIDKWITTYWYNCNPMTNPGRALMSRSLIENAGTWNEKLSLNDDLEFFTRIMVHAEKVIFNHEAILSYRSGISGISSLKGKTAFESAFTAIELSVKMALAQCGDSEIIRQSCANIWQNFIYDAYPRHQDLIQKAEEHLSHLPAPSISFSCGGYTKFLVNLTGWKIAKKIKSVIN